MRWAHGMVNVLVLHNEGYCVNGHTIRTCAVVHKKTGGRVWWAEKESKLLINSLAMVLTIPWC